MNLLSVAAAYGVVTFVFQEGHGREPDRARRGAIPIVSYVPLLMFAILFGLSMDYEVFLLTPDPGALRARPETPTQAVVDGLADTGRVITSAALIMVCVFTSFVLNGDPIVKEFGVGLAVAIAIDATIVRCLLVPGGHGAARQARTGGCPRWLARACRESGSRARSTSRRATRRRPHPHLRPAARAPAARASPPRPR